jgi:hypothetical protein
MALDTRSLMASVRDVQIAERPGVPAHIAVPAAAPFAVPVLLLLGAFMVVAFGTEFQGLGPLDVGTAEALAVALWVAAPLTGGVLARDTVHDRLPEVAWFLGALTGAGLTLLLVTAPMAAVSVCSSAPTPSGLPWLLGCLGLGVLVGTGTGLAVGIAGAAARRGRWVIPGLVLAVVVTFTASAVAYQLLYTVVVCLH